MYKFCYFRILITPPVGKIQSTTKSKVSTRRLNFGARVLISAESLTIIEEKKREKKELEDAKEKRKQERESKRQLHVENEDKKKQERSQRENNRNQGEKES